MMVLEKRDWCVTWEDSYLRGRAQHTMLCLGWVRSLALRDNVSKRDVRLPDISRHTIACFLACFLTIIVSNSKLHDTAPNISIDVEESRLAIIIKETRSMMYIQDNNHLSNPGDQLIKAIKGLAARSHLIR